MCLLNLRLEIYIQHHGMVCLTIQFRRRLSLSGLFIKGFPPAFHGLGIIDILFTAFYVLLQDHGNELLQSNDIFLPVL
jgi:hypothetical protein